MSIKGQVALLAALVLCAGPCTAATIGDIDADPRKAEIGYVVDAKLMNLYAKDLFKPNAPLTEKDCASALTTLASAIPSAPTPDFTVISPGKPIQRIRALAAVVKCLAPKPEIDSLQDAATWLGGFSDSSEIPKWAINHAAYAVKGNLVPSEDRFRPNQPMTRSEFAWLLARALPKPAASDGYTGLVVDCGALPLRRSMAPTVLDEDGNTIYPDEKNLPTIEFMEDQGMASFVSDPTKSTRAGARPLTVKAVRLESKKRDTVVISTDDARKLLEEEKRGHFLAKWNVTFVVGGVQPAPTEESKESTSQE